MGKPEKKLKKMLLILGITGAVYGSFRFLLPLVIPFLLSWGIAVCLRPSAEWIAERCRFTLKFGGRRRTVGIPVGAAGVLELLVLLALLGIGIYYGGCKLIAEAGMLLDRIPQWIGRLDVWLTSVCHELESALCLKTGVLVLLMREMLKGLLETVTAGAMPYLMANSVTVFRVGIGISVISVILLISVGLCLQEMDVWKARCERSVYRQEYHLIAGRLATVGSAYLKSQGTIILLTTAICTAGLWLMQNPYYVLAGVGIGILDALPVFGTGTVLIPWAGILFAGGSWGRGLWLLALYLICYFLREILEAKLVGDKVGLSPLETLIAIYVGLQLFGIVGFLLGPVGLLLIRDLVEAQMENASSCS